ncbi:TauD/TfdA dioxygenase family protein [Bordetella sp. 02P26C-1]|uniref:TauD/TfdA dioxygenase family protein n=1 Tax=Bordetella sp. 02P26C-1 TaxID=2683195 RepID=UPI001352650A|nr:TauD/TfdA family dioxygenase [Bordetella sp. 02P26C-1]MVW79932.1 TauD/TfdA family dioxygenase [Bordetella sp. 02P26C-1]
MQVIEQKNAVHVQPSGAALGADVAGVDLSQDLSETEQEIIKQAWADNLVLRFRRQPKLEVEDLVRFSRYFGDLDKAPPASTQMGEDFAWQHPEITVISNVVANGKPIGDLGSSEAVWHSDMTYNPKPPKGSALYAIEIPPAGGNTQFANMYLAYETLPDRLKSRIADLRCVHDASRNSAGGLRKGYVDNTDPRETVGATHPMVRVHPVTGKKCLFLGRRRKAYIVGLELEDSEALLNELWQHACQDSFVWTQEWQLGDLVLWDNRCTMHRRDAFDPNTRRLLYRTQVTGEEVLAAAEA